MGWASSYITDLKDGKTVTFRPKGKSMSGKIESGQLCTVEPIVDQELEVGMIVLCKVKGNEYLHLIDSIGKDGRCMIANNKGYQNGWASKKAIYGICTKVED